MAYSGTLVNSFQSHAGSIEAPMPLSKIGQALGRFNTTLVRLRPLPPSTPPRSPTSGFNPTLVRLRPPRRQRKDLLLPPVSIPRWFD